MFQAELDLHGVRHAEVGRKVIRFVESHWNSDKEAKIITGHSRRMKVIVKDILNEYKLSWTDNHGEPYIRTRFE